MADLYTKWVEESTQKGVGGGESSFLQVLHITADGHSTLKYAKAMQRPSP